MSTTLHRRLKRLEIAVRQGQGNRANVTLIEPATDDSNEQWQQFVTRKAEAEAMAETIVVIRSCQPVRQIDYRGRVVIVPPKIPALVEVRPILMEGNHHAH